MRMRERRREKPCRRTRRRLCLLSPLSKLPGRGMGISPTEETRTGLKSFSTSVCENRVNF
jgi:hypothetical protein